MKWCFKKFQGCCKTKFQEVSWKIEGYFEGVLREFQLCFKEVLRMIQGSFRAVQMKFPWCFKKFQGCCKTFRFDSLRDVLKALKGFFKTLSEVFQEGF